MAATTQTRGGHLQRVQPRNIDIRLAGHVRRATYGRRVPAHSSSMDSTYLLVESARVDGVDTMTTVKSFNLIATDRGG